MTHDEVFGKNSIRVVSWPGLDDDFEKQIPRDVFEDFGKSTPYSTIPPYVSWFLLPAAAYVGKKGFDLTLDLVKTWLLSRPKCDHQKVTIYGPEGEIVSIISCDEKHCNHPRTSK
jgi:hypothetical protein